MRGQSLLLLLLGFVFETQCMAAANPRLYNAGFDHGAIEGVPCEWTLQGEARAINSEGIQALSGISAGTEVNLSQVVYLCTPGIRYKATLIIKDVTTPATLIRIGLDPTGGQDPQQTVWNNANAPGQVSVECLAAGNNCQVIISLSNPSQEASASFDGVEFTPLSTIRNLGPQPPMADEATRAAADIELKKAMDILDKKTGPIDAERILLKLVQDYPDARPEAAMALVKLQASRHARQPDVYKMPRKEWEDYLGLPYLCETLKRYPEQTEACALALCNMGSHYLNFSIIPQGREFLQSTIEDYPGTEAFWWAKVYMINALLWSGDPTAASEMLMQVENAYGKQEASIKQKAWAEYIYYGQRIDENWSTDARKASSEFHDKIWKQYRESFPEIAIRSKLYKANKHEIAKEFYLSVDDYHEMLKYVTIDQPHMGPPRLNLARILLTRGWLSEHREEGLRLLEEVAASVLASTDMRESALRDIDTYVNHDGYNTIAWKQPPRGVNLLKNGDFEKPPEYWEDPDKYSYKLWRFEIKPNWPSCDWTENAPPPGLGQNTPAWSSINGGPIRGRLIHDAIIIDGSAPIRAGVWVAADSWDSGVNQDVRYLLTLNFLDGFNRPLGEISSKKLSIESGSKVWEEHILAGTTPENACYAEFIITLDVSGNGQHNTALTGATLVLGDN